MKKTSTTKTKSKSKDADLTALLIQKANALYDIEQALVKALPKMAKAATDKDLKNGFTAHLAETKNHVVRLEEVHELLGVKPKKLKAEGIHGIIKDGEWVIKNVTPAEALDSNLVRAAQYAEHYEIAGYTGAIEWAKTLGLTDVVNLLSQNLEEEVAADLILKKAGATLDKLIA